MVNNLKKNKKNLNSVSCIIPYHNEKGRIENVLEVVTQITEFSSIVCVDDGSTDDSHKLIRRKFKKVLVIRLKKNLGKAGAIAFGIKQVKSEFIFLMDGDLQNLKISEIKNAIKCITTTDSIDMIIMRRKNDPWFSKLIRGDITVSGERIIRTNDLINAYKNKPTLYQIEFAINLYMIKNNKRTYWLPFSGENVPKVKKIGYIQGIKKELYMYLHYVQYAGIAQALIIIFTFCKQQIPYSIEE